MKERLFALEKKVAAEGLILTEAQLVALEKKKEEAESLGEIDTQHPGYLTSQDTFYVGTLKGVGRIYQQTVVDTYSKIAFAKLYSSKTPITAAEILNDRVIPFFEGAHDRFAPTLQKRVRPKRRHVGRRSKNFETVPSRGSS